LQDIDIQAVDQQHPTSICGDHNTEGHQHYLSLTQPPTNQKVDNKKKGTAEDEDNKEILADPNDPDKKFMISSKLNPK
jgi:hypothetical protein